MKFKTFCSENKLSNFTTSLTNLTVVSNALLGAQSMYKENKDIVGEKEINNALIALSKVIRFLTKLKEE